MQTSDNNIVHVEFVVSTRWERHSSRATAWPTSRLLRDSAQAAMREVIGATPSMAC
jgi:regulator of protease activity HflC (stomatin/prohibitin superfamily)